MQNVATVPYKLYILDLLSYLFHRVTAAAAAKAKKNQYYEQKDHTLLKKIHGCGIAVFLQTRTLFSFLISDSVDPGWVGG